MARKKIVLVIVEGPSDDAALGVILNRLFDKNTVHVEIMYGDITTDMSIDPVDIAKALGDVVKRYADSMHFKQLHFQQVQLVLPALLDSSVVCFVDSDSVIRIGGVGLQPVGVFICSSSQVTKLVTRLMMKLNC